MKNIVILLTIAGTSLFAANHSPQKEAAAPAATTRRYINLPRPNATTSLPFSHGVIVGDTLYISGTIGLDPKTGKPPADTEAEARLTLDSVQAVLKKANMTMDDLVSVTVFCSDLSQYDKFNSVYRTYFKKDFPARAFIGSGNLLFGAKFEVQAIARRR